MKPHTRIIYYTLLCLALNHRRSKACIYCCMEAEEAPRVSALLGAPSTRLCYMQMCWRIRLCGCEATSSAIKRDEALQGFILKLNPC